AGPNHKPRREALADRFMSADPGVGSRAWRQRAIPSKRPASRAWNDCRPPSITRKARRRSGAVTTGSIGCVATAADAQKILSWEDRAKRYFKAELKRADIGLQAGAL